MFWFVQLIVILRNRGRTICLEERLKQERIVGLILGACFLIVSFILFVLRTDAPHILPVMTGFWSLSATGVAASVRLDLEDCGYSYPARLFSLIAFLLGLATPVINKLSCVIERVLGG